MELLHYFNDLRMLMPSGVARGGAKQQVLKGASLHCTSGHSSGEPFWTWEQNGGECLQNGRGAGRLPVKCNALTLTSCATVSAGL